MNTSELIEGISLEQEALAKQKIILAPIIFLFSDYFISKSQLFKETYLKGLVIKLPPKLLDIQIIFQIFLI